ncbi:MAG: DUF1559 domain-containing protein [Thermoguttaceae bacterium]|nr:DUF1559 domain-containing protein [Thermoguttaceae bacterium]MDW8038067.1 DUF1559 domain-containing protein [Thermoguttaceae bacterium]
MKGSLQLGLVLVVVGLMLYSPMCCWAGESMAQVSAQPTKSSVDKTLLAYIPPDATVVLVIQPQRVLTAPEWKLLPTEVFSALGKQHFGFDPAKMSLGLLVIELIPEKQPLLGFLGAFVTPLEMEKVFPELREYAIQEQVEGRPYYRASSPEGISLFLPDQRTLLVGQEQMLRRMVASRAKAKLGKLAQILAAMDLLADAVVVVDFAPIDAALETQRVPPAPEWKLLPEGPRRSKPGIGLALGLSQAAEWQWLPRITPLIRSAVAEINLTKELEIRLTLQAPNEAAAQQWQSQIKSLYQMVKESWVEDMLRFAGGPKEDPVRQTFVQYMDRVWEELWASLQPQQAGAKLTLQFRRPWHDIERAAIGGALAYILLEINRAYRQDPYVQSMNNLRQIGLAMYNFFNGYARFPNNIKKDGKPLLSWRVHLLPYLEEQELYQQFRLDEPWDSPHNRKLIERMPKVFQSPGIKTKPGMTVYLGLVGEGTLFEGDKKRRLPDITDGTSNTIMLVEADPDRAVPWTKPEDLPFDPEKPLAGLGTARKEGILVLFCDGSVRLLPSQIDPETFRRLAIINDGQPVDRGKF